MDKQARKLGFQCTYAVVALVYHARYTYEVKQNEISKGCPECGGIVVSQLHCHGIGSIDFRVQCASCAIIGKKIYVYVQVGQKTTVTMTKILAALLITIVVTTCIILGGNEIVAQLFN